MSFTSGVKERGNNGWVETNKCCEKYMGDKLHQEKINNLEKTLNRIKWKYTCRVIFLTIEIRT